MVYCFYYYRYFSCLFICCCFFFKLAHAINFICSIETFIEIIKQNLYQQKKTNTCLKDQNAIYIHIVFDKIVNYRTFSYVVYVFIVCQQSFKKIIWKKKKVGAVVWIYTQIIAMKSFESIIEGDTNYKIKKKNWINNCTTNCFTASWYKELKCI